MPRLARRTSFRGSARGSAYVATAALVVTMAPVLALASAQAASAAASPPAGDALWTPTSERVQSSSDGHRRRVNPRAYRAYELDTSALDSVLAGATESRAVTLRVPAPNGDLVAFEVVDSPVMEPELAAKHPEIRTFAGKSVADTGATIRLDVTRMGFHAAVRGPGASWYVDPAYNGDDSLYVSYLGSSLPTPEKELVEPDLDEVQLDAAQGPLPVGEGPGGVVIKRTYRLAFLTDQTYARYFGSANVLSEKVTLMNRVNQIYNDDLGVHMILINETDKLNLDTDAEAVEPNGPCGSAACFTPAQLAGCTGGLLTRNQTVIGQIIGASNYDIGHIGLGVNGGGVAQLGVVGGQNKARGCTGLPQPEGDFYAVDYVAHEMGHQFAGNHTFNGTLVNCGGNKAAPAVEPGSGSSVMAYAGICGQDDLQPHTDPYFSQRSQTEISTYVLGTRVVNEVQTISLYNFGGTDSFRLTFGGGTTPEIVNGVNYTAAGIDAALESLPSIGLNGVSVQAWGGAGTLTTEGFQVTFNGNTAANGGTATIQTAGIDQAFIAVAPATGDVTGDTRERDQGGPAENAGFQTLTPGNRAPVATAPDPKTIPLRTPFALTGTASDADQDSLVYLWEQNDAGTGTGTSLISQTKTNGPLFRVFSKYADVTPAGTLVINSPGENLADGNPTRVFPDMDQILANNTNAATGTCPDAPATGSVPVPVRECFAEWLPTADYVGSAVAGNSEPSLNFRFTARDLDPQAGGYSFGDTKLLIDKGMGPFLVSSKNNPAAAVGGRTEVVSWAVANTNGYTDSTSVVHPSIAPTVRITLSTDGGKTFPVVLADNTPNDGSQPVTWPDVSTTKARIKIEAVGNYFFDVNNADFEIIGRNTPPGETGGDTVTKVNAPNRDVALHRSVRIRVRVLATTGTERPAGEVRVVVRRKRDGRVYFRETKAYEGQKLVFISPELHKRGKYTVTARYRPRAGSGWDPSLDTDRFRVVRAN